MNDEEGAMASYFVFFRFTERGVKNVRESPARVEAAKKSFRELGATVEAFYALMGAYDTVFIVEAPDDETAARAALATASLGNVRTETVRAFDEDEFKRIVAALP